MGGLPVIRALEITDLAISRGGRRLFSGVSLTLGAGEACAVTGANGAGTTSLLRAVAGFLTPEAGRIAFSGAGAAGGRAADLHFLGHQDGLKPARTGAEELIFWTRWDGAAPQEVEAAVEALALAPLLPLEIRRLSAGQRRRLALARLAATARPLWLLDEPFGPLDARWRACLATMMTRHLDGGGLILAAVHDPLPIPARELEIAP